MVIITGVLLFMPCYTTASNLEHNRLTETGGATGSNLEHNRLTETGGATGFVGDQHGRLLTETGGATGFVGDQHGRTGSLHAPFVVESTNGYLHVSFGIYGIMQESTKYKTSMC